VQLTGNINRLLAETADAARVLDVGGAHRPLNTATHTLDALPYSDRGPVLFRDVEAELARFKKTLRRLRGADAAKRAGRIRSEAAPDPRGAGA
jgi:hypothetical protein